MMYGLHVTMVAAPGKTNELLSVLNEVPKLMAQMKGCQMYLVQQSAEQPARIFVTEVWEHQEFHQRSLSNLAILELIGRARPLIDGIHRETLKIHAGHPRTIFSGMHR